MAQVCIKLAKEKEREEAGGEASKKGRKGFSPSLCNGKVINVMCEWMIARTSNMARQVTPFFCRQKMEAIITHSHTHTC